MLDSLIPTGIMFVFTAFFTTLFFIPITRFPQKHKLVNFYWVGFWLFLAAIAAFSGGMNALLIMQMDTLKFGNAVLFSITICFVLFVMFAWFRLVGLALMSGAKKVSEKF